ncbi:MAG: N(4)-(beta-N-acetylglucosaminyl)-L-asparaginase [Candidatus Eisenbacteria bacterium]
MKSVILANGEGGVGMRSAIDVLLRGRAALDAAEAGVRVVETDPSVRSVGVGGAPNILGEMECDASIMCGATLHTGAVGALKKYLHAIAVARGVMERTPHVMLVGEGALRFAAEMEAERGNLLTDEARADYEEWLSTHIPADVRARWESASLAPLVSQPVRHTRHGGAGKAGDAPQHGTVTYLVLAADGTMVGGVSTSGWAYKYPGRLSDSCIIGAGLYVDDRYGGAACTHTGEMIIRAGLARAVVAYMKKGATVSEACHEAFDDLRSLKGGTLGPVILHALDRNAEPYVLTTGNDGGIPYWFWTEGMTQAECRKPIIELL